MTVEPGPVSVVIPARNAEAFIGDAVASAIRQTVPPYEVIVVDDGSTDETAARAKAAGAKLVTGEARGVSAARNLGLDYASSTYVAFLDADDIWHPDKLRVQLRGLRTFPMSRFIFTDYTKFRRDEIVAPIWTQTRARYLAIDRLAFSPDRSTVRFDLEGFAAGLAAENFIPTSSVLVARETLIGAGGFDESLIFCEDHDLWLRLLVLTEAIAVEQALMRYRLHDENTSHAWAKMLEGDCDLGRRIVLHPDRYLAATVTVARDLQAERSFALGVHLVKTGEPGRARGAFAESMRVNPELRTRAYSVGAGLLSVPGIVTALRWYRSRKR